jgi:hypothetical protein
MGLSIAELAVIIHADHNEVHSPDLEGTELALTVFQGIEPESIKMIEKHLALGSSEFRDETAEYVRGMLGAIYSTYTNIGKDWKLHCQFVIGHHFIENMMRLWSFHHVSEYRNFNLNLFESSMLMGKIADELETVVNERFAEHPVNYEDWTGLAALVCTGIDHRTLENKQMVDFINYAGTHRNLAAVIDTAADRKVVNPETVEGLINQDDILSVMRAGTL